MNFNHVWLDEFGKRNSFESYRLFGEFRDVNIESIIFKLLELWKKISKCSINNVSNADEFGSFYRLNPDSSIEPSRFAGKKKENEQLSS